jgi:CRP/FNR family transcriptional regulator, cyclic AMP receptor protein
MATPSSHLHRIRPLLTKNSFLGRLPEVVLDALLEKGQLKKFGKGDVIYRRGAPGDSLMVIVDGRIKLTNTNLTGKEIVLYFLAPNEIFGEVAALDGKERAADAIAMDDVEVFVIGTRDFLPALMDHPPAMLAIVRALCEKLRTGAVIIEDNSLEMRARAARGLLRLAQQQGRIDTSGARQLTMTQEELGKHLAMSRANMNRQLGQLRIAKLVAVSGTAISITDEAGLADLAQMSSLKG